MFLHLSVILYTGVGVSVRETPLVRRPLDIDPPPPDRDPLDGDPPWTETPRTETPPKQRPPPGRRTVTIGRYASYWNAFLLCLCFVMRCFSLQAALISSGVSPRAVRICRCIAGRSSAGSSAWPWRAGTKPVKPSPCVNPHPDPKTHHSLAMTFFQYETHVQRMSSLGSQMRSVREYSGVYLFCR